MSFPSFGAPVAAAPSSGFGGGSGGGSGGFAFGAPAAAGGGTGGGSAFQLGGTSGPAAPGASGSSSHSVPAPSSTTGFSFGGGSATSASTSASTSAPATTTAPAPGASGGFSFGGSTTPAPASASSGVAGGFSFGGSTTTSTTAGAAAPVSSFSFSSSSSNQQQQQPQASPPVILMPSFEKTFPNVAMYHKLKKLIGKATSTTGGNSGSGSIDASRSSSRLSLYEGQELYHLVTTATSPTSYLTALSQPTLPPWTAPNPGLRQQFVQTRTVGITDAAGNDGSTTATTTTTTTTTTTLTPLEVQRIIELSNDLRISEDQATALYGQVSSDLDRIRTQVLPYSTLERAGYYSNPNNDAAMITARDFYFWERHLALETLLWLVQARLQNDPYVLQATDVLLQPSSSSSSSSYSATGSSSGGGLISSLLNLIQDATQRMGQLQQELSAAAAAASTSNGVGMMMHGGMVGGSSTVNPSDPAASINRNHFAHVHLYYCRSSRQTACQILLFLAYHTQWTMSEVTQLLDLIRDMTSQCPIPDPFSHVPSPYERQQQSQLPTVYGNNNPWSSSTSNHQPFFVAPLQDKPFREWQLELVQQVQAAGQPALLQSLSVLLATAMAALDATQILHDRHTHTPQEFRGNAILPPGMGNAGLSQLQPLQDRLDPSVVERHWTRPDMGGLLTASYVLLLRSAVPTLVMMGSPRIGTMGGGAAMAAFVQTARHAVSTPADFKSFSFGLHSLLPALQRLPNILSNGPSCQTSEFGLSILTEFVAKYMDECLTDDNDQQQISTSSSVSSSLPLSRLRWKIEEEEQLQLRRDNQARAREFEQWQSHSTSTSGGHDGGTSTSRQHQYETIPSSVDLMARPDCLDDIVALAVELCALGPEYSRNFWDIIPQQPDDSSHDGTSMTHLSMRPCRTLQALERAVLKDDSLLPCYLSWLGALAKDPASAEMVWKRLSATPSPPPTTATTTTTTMSGAGPDAATMPSAITIVQPRPPHEPPIGSMTWPKLIANLRWYAQELSPYDAEGAVRSTSTANTTSSSSSTSQRNTSYYYSLDGDFIQGSSGVGGGLAGTPNPATAGQGSASTTGAPLASSSSTSTSDNNATKNKKLSESSLYYLASHLAVLRNVAKHCPQARHDILSIILPLGGGSVPVASATRGGSLSSSISSSSSIPVGDETLLILFKLAIAPLPPAIRGATLAAIASLLLVNGNATTLTQDQQEELAEQGKRAWDYLDACPLLPIDLLDQYNAVNGNNTTAAFGGGIVAAGQQVGRIGLSFPPSTATLVNTNNQSAVGALLPMDPNYGLLYEMEYVESAMGWYPSTEGCLELIEALVGLVGCPMDLGRDVRIRTGAAPYIEYVTDFVLARALGTGNCQPLPYRVPGDQARLVTKALRVVQAILVRYTVPTKALKGATIDAPALAVPEIVNRVSLPCSTPEQELLEDFLNSKTMSTGYGQQATTTFQSSNTVSSSSASLVAPSTNIPRPKSPGFWIMANLLLSSRSALLEAVVKVVVAYGGSSTIQSLFGGDDMALTYATFVSTPPNLVSAREGAKEGEPTKPKHTFLRPLVPALEDMVVQDTSFDMGSMWRESSIATALLILCAVAVREEAFGRAVTAFPEVLRVVPVLRFEEIRFGSSNLKVVDVSVSRLVHLVTPYLPAVLVDYIGYKAWDDSIDATIAGTALALAQAWSRSERLKTLAPAVAVRLLIAAQRLGSKLDDEATTLILHWILTDLRAGIAGEGSAAQVLLGLPTRFQNGNWNPNNATPGKSAEDCFDAMLEMLQNLDYATSKEQSVVASMCLECIFRLYNLIATQDISALRVVVYTSQRLRAVRFWESNLLMWLSSRGSQPLQLAGTSDLTHANPDALHAMGWFLKGLACELNLLMGLSGSDSAEAGLGHLTSPEPVQCQKLLEVLFASDEPLILNLIESLPIDALQLNPSLKYPPNGALHSGVESWPGPSDVSSGYFKVNKEKVFLAMQPKPVEEDLQSMIEWMDEWNTLVARNCASSHLSNAMYMVLDCATAASEAFRMSGAEISPACLSPNFMMHTAILLLERMLVGATERPTRGMDANFYCNATRNMANAVLLLVDTLTGSSESEWPSAVDLLHLASFLARAVAYSSIGSDSDAEAPTRHERTIALSKALAALLRITSQDEQDLVMQYRDDFLMAAKALAKLSVFEVYSNSQGSSSVVAILARSSLSTIIACCSDLEDNQKETSFCVQLLNAPSTRSLMALVATMDVSICSLLQTVVEQPFGVDVLLNARLFDALEAAATKYAHEEADVIAKISDEVGGYRQVKIRAPEFLMGHLRLLTSLLISSLDQLSSPARQNLPGQIMSILRHYKTTFQRLCFNFPFEGDVLRAFLRCFVEAACLASPQDPHDRFNELMPSFRRHFKDLFTSAGFLESGILVLCKQLLDFPLPRGLLPPPPKELKSSSDTDGDNRVVHIESDKQQSWWDVLEVLLSTQDKTNQFSFKAPIGSNDFGNWGSRRPKAWNENQFEYAIVGADILALSLSLIKNLEHVGIMDGNVLARGLHQTIFASLTIERRFEEVKQQLVGPSASFGSSSSVDSTISELEMEYLKVFGSTMARCVEELVVVCLLSLKGGSNENIPNSIHPLQLEALRLVFQQTGLETTGVGFLSHLPDGPKRVDLLQQICQKVQEPDYQ